MPKCQIANCIICEHEDYLESLSRGCKHNQGYATSIYGGGVYCVLCGLDMETIA